MDLESLIDQLLEPTKTVEISLQKELVENVLNGRKKIVDVIQSLDKVLTNADHRIRLKGTEILTSIITSLPSNFLTEKEIEVLSEFLCQRLIDHKSMERDALKSLTYFLSCSKKPRHYNKTLLEFLKSKVNVSKMEIGNRFIVYGLLKQVITEKRTLSVNIESDLIYSLIHLIEGESNPQNLLSCFGIVSFVMKNFENLEPYTDDLFEWLCSYYPIDYTPDEDDFGNSSKVSRSELVDALYECFLANKLNAANLQTLLLEKLDSNILSTKLESINLLIKCYQQADLKCVHEFSSTTWTCIRMECLKKINLANPQLLEANYRLLTALTTKLAEDDERYFTFVSDMYEELAIAFRKPEMDLFEPAARLIAHAIEPKLKGFNYVLSQILPTSINAIKAGECRPISGIVYIFQHLALSHPRAELLSDIRNYLNTLVTVVSSFESLDPITISLLKVLIRTKVDLTDEVLNKMITKLSFKPLTDDNEECLALIADKYNKIEVISFDEKSDKYPIYLKLKTLRYNNYDESQLDKEDLEDLLRKSRWSVIATREQNIIKKVSILHGIIMNKVSPGKLQPLMMDLFKSDYCQNLVPTDETTQKNCPVYMPILQYALKALVLRNDKLQLPLINLILNFVTSGNVDEDEALVVCQVFKFVVDEIPLFDPKQNFKIFALHKQKFFTVSSKEIRLRCQIPENSLKKDILVSALAAQIPHLGHAIYKKDIEWFTREILRILSGRKKQCNDTMIQILYECLEKFMADETKEYLVKLLDSIINLDLSLAFEGSFQARMRAISNLNCIASSFKDSELLNRRSLVVNKLKLCLSDKKRLVRQIAGRARLKWIIVGQPIGQ